jgi:two-component system OmpR family sensor kinase
MKGRLYLRLYVALLASSLVCLTVAGVAFRLWSRAGGPAAERLQSAAEAIDEQIGDTDIHVGDLRARLSRIAAEYSVDVIVGGEGGPRVGFPSVRAFVWPTDLSPGMHRERGGPVFVTPLAGALAGGEVAGRGGTVAVIRARGPYRRLRLHPFFTTLIILAVVMAAGSYPVARRVARRLEALARGVEEWGSGALDRRVAVNGRDEIALLATTFNQAAERVSLLLVQQKQMLANASHELRSPLARLRMGLELIAEEPDGERRRGRVAEIHADIVELDELIEEILLFARADARVPGRPLAKVDVAALCLAEAQRTGARFENEVTAGQGAIVDGDETLLRHMIRNLLENAQRHGGGSDVRIILSLAPPRPDDGGRSGALVIRVEDAGPGIPEAERERIFAPFYRPPAALQRDKSDSSVRAGHGVGLALVRQVARYHGGTASYRPRPGGGSAFEVTLRASAPAA